MKKLLVVFIFIFSFCTTSSFAQTDIVSHNSDVVIVYDTADIFRLNEAFLKLINEERAKHWNGWKRLHPLTIDTALIYASLQHSLYQVYEGILGNKMMTHDHSNVDNPYYEEPSMFYFGENISGYFTSAEGGSIHSMTDEEIQEMAKLFFSSWKASNMHYGNMISKRVYKMGIAMSALRLPGSLLGDGVATLRLYR